MERLQAFKTRVDSFKAEEARQRGKKHIRSVFPAQDHFLLGLEKPAMIHRLSHRTMVLKIWEEMFQLESGKTESKGP